MMCYQLNGDTMWEYGREYKLINGNWVEVDKQKQINQAIKESQNEKQGEQQIINQNQDNKAQVQQDVQKQEDIQNQLKQKQSQLDKDQI